MKAFVTGNAGFVGRHVTAELKRRGWDVSGCDIATNPGIVLPEDDANWHFLHNVTRYDLVVHAAASAPHRTAIDTQPEHFARNVQLDAAMFAWATSTRQRHVIYLSSSAAYPTALQLTSIMGRLHEDDIDLNAVDQPDSVYGWTKLTGEQMARAARQHGLSVTVVRPFSGYGEDQTADFPFRAIIERVKRRENPVTVWGAGTQVRDWIHIDDVVAGMLAVAESGTEQPVNLCTGTGASMFDLAYLAAGQAGHDAMIAAVADKPSGVHYRVGDPARFHGFYTPKISLEEGVARALHA